MTGCISISSKCVRCSRPQTSMLQCCSVLDVLCQLWHITLAIDSFLCDTTFDEDSTPAVQQLRGLQLLQFGQHKAAGQVLDEPQAQQGAKDPVGCALRQRPSQHGPWPAAPWDQPPCPAAQGSLQSALLGLCLQGLVRPLNTAAVTTSKGSSSSFNSMAVSLSLSLLSCLPSALPLPLH